ncbi:hypothetical protein [Novosphingobium mangrovi (ex Hu et al. 2023)]|uniref:SnoaL-like domain-containing protein n=1 Tax=Novosphingobium mangrovi (ex Hu et al. 2023) TaxID=2930094 RepID=A0ABT0AE32_9SPHN|nr:hypothetical protein [Novosphingobium mangrovi (ex Hu et al. 2023)]MCJ1961439.1 hypothetical protein [Novosphingobium mangrovi (ex Hu et al. 2023)]
MNAVPTSKRHHIALSLAHRWFAFFEAPGGDLKAHLAIFHPHVRLSGHRGQRLFAQDHETLRAWFAAVPDEVSSHHILHSVYEELGPGSGRLAFLVAYQAPGADGAVHGSIISYDTQVAFGGEPRFLALDKTPTLPNTRPTFEPSWATNRVLARLHAELGGLGAAGDANGQVVRSAMGGNVQALSVLTRAPDGSSSYEALASWIGGTPATPSSLRLAVCDDVRAPLPTIQPLRTA